MPTKIPSPADGGEYGLVAKDGDGREWCWDDEEMIWILTADDGDTECPDAH